MKFIHIADVHLGASPDAGEAYNKKREREIWESFEEIIEICEEDQVDFLLIAGDLFHRQPLVRELKEVDYLFAKLSVTKVVFIAGNHDYVKPDSYYLSFSWSANVYPLLDRKLERVEFPDQGVCIYGFSYHQKIITEPLYDEQYPLKRQPIEILLAHGGDENHIPIRKAKMSALGYSYIALGHIHKPQQLEENRMYYPGALEPLDKNDTGPHGYLYGEISHQEAKVVFIPNSKRMYLHEEVAIDADTAGYGVRELIAERIRDKGERHMYKIILTGYRDPEVLFDLEGMDRHGNIVEIVDETKPAYDFARLERDNADNLLGKFIRGLGQAEPGSLEYQALYEGVWALLRTRRG